MEFNYRDEIKLNLLKRKSNNPNYSMRAYSRDLGVSLTALSSVIAGKRNLSLKNALKIAENLNFSPLQVKSMVNSIKNIPMEKLLNSSDLIQEDEFNLIANWYCIALLTLVRNNKTKNSPKALSKKLGVEVKKIKQSIDILLRLNFIEIKSGLIIRKIKNIKTTNDISSSAIRKYHQSNLDLAQKCLHTLDVSKRHITNLSLSVAEKDIGKAKKLINKFKKEFDEKIDTKTANQVYNFSIQFFPAQDIRSKEIT